MAGQGPVDVVQLLLVVDMHFAGQADVVAFAAGAHVDGGGLKAGVDGAE